MNVDKLLHICLAELYDLMDKTEDKHTIIEIKRKILKFKDMQTQISNSLYERDKFGNPINI